MSYTSAIDISQWQSNIDWSQVPQPIAIIKMSGGDAGLYYDSKATQNYYNAKAAGKAVGCYHFAGAGDPTAEADYFVQACSPLEQDDVLVLDWEVSHPDPVGWCNTFCTRVHEKTGVWPLIYMNASTANTHDWTVVFNNCGLWVAAWNNDPDGPAVTPHTYVMHQYTSDGSVPGIAGRVDLDAWYGSVEQFKKYGYQVAQPPVEPPVVTPPTEPPVVPPPVDPPVVTPPIEPPVVPPVSPPTPSDKGKVILGAFLAGVAAVVAWLISLLT
jgi:GH25 family lysozyme M1 (1,4-beta-N-acetylmuramidase)